MEFRGQERTSLLEFLVQQLHSKKPELLTMPSQLESVAKASESKFIVTYLHIRCVCTCIYIHVYNLIARCYVVAKIIEVHHISNSTV